MKVLIINGSVRESRATTRVVKWVEKTASSLGNDVEFSTIDLKELSLPMFDEPVSPMMNQNRVTEGNVKVWVDALAEADGYVFVTPEYNHSMPSGLKNAIDYIAREVMRKPFTIVSHGVNGGARAAENVKLALNANIGAVPIANTVTINGMVAYHELVSEDGEINVEKLPEHTESLKKALDALIWYTDALKTKRDT